MRTASCCSALFRRVQRQRSHRGAALLSPVWRLRHGPPHARARAAAGRGGGAAGAVERRAADEALRRSAREQLAVMFRAAVRGVAEDNARHLRILSGDGAGAACEEDVAADVKVIACERENARFGDYQCNDAMKVRAGAAAGRHGPEDSCTAN